MDVVGDVLALSSVRGTVAASVDAAEPWGLRLSRIPGAAFHAITAGTAWLRMPGEADTHLMPGDVVLLPTGAAHTLASDKHARLVPFERLAAEQAGTGGGTVRVGDGSPQTRILCASYQHDPAIKTPLFDLLPVLVHVPAATRPPALDDTIRLLAGELGHPRMGASIVLNRLVDVLLVQVLRAWLEVNPEPRGSWLGALADPTLSAALTAIHHRPDRAWTIESLAEQVGVSRATLARRFGTQIGASPLAYLTRWRMDLAATRLRDTDEPVHTVATSVGYQSEQSFSRAFSRDRGQSPGRYRRLARAAGP